MRNFNFRDGKFKFEMLTDDSKVVVAKLKLDKDNEFVGVSNVKGDDQFDLHTGMQIAIRQCVMRMRSAFTQQVMKMENRLEKDIGNMKYFDRETFKMFRERRLAKIARQNAKKEATE